MTTEPPYTAGQLLAEYRNRLGLTQEQLAERADLSPRTIQDIEAGRSLTPRKDTVQRLTRALGLSPQERSQFEAAVSDAAKQRRIWAARSSEQPPTGLPRTRGDIIAATPSKLGVPATRMAVIIAAGVVVVITVLLWLPQRLGCLHPAAEGVTLYELPCYQGRSLILTESDLDLCDNQLDPASGKVDPCFSAPSWNDVASSIWVGPGYRVELHLHNPDMADDAMLLFGCNTAIPDFKRLRFPGGESVDNSVSRIIIERTACP